MEEHLSEPVEVAETPDEEALPRKKSRTRETTETIVISLLLALFTRAAIAEPRYIPSESMLPTLKVQDRLLIEKISNYTHTHERGEILVFYPPSEIEANQSVFEQSMQWLGFTSKKAYIKRVVGLPGETIAVSHGQVYINGQPLDESAYIMEPPIYELEATVIPPGHVFMMGDNRNDSHDSHVWGPLPIDNVIGRAAFRFWPLKRMGGLE